MNEFDVPDKPLFNYAVIAALHVHDHMEDMPYSQHHHNDLSALGDISIALKASLEESIKPYTGGELGGYKSILFEESHQVPMAPVKQITEIVDSKTPLTEYYWTAKPAEIAYTGIRKTLVAETPSPTTSERPITDQKIEQSLADRFVSGVSKLSVEELAVAMPDRKLPRSLAKFSLVPVTAKYPGTTSATAAGHGVSVPDDIRTTYSKYSSNGRPYMDSQFGIGLVKGDWLVGLAAGAIDEHGRLKIVQIQDVSGTNTDKQGGNADHKQRMRTGLHDGFDWRATLVEAWATLIENEGISHELVVQSGKNNRWSAVKSIPHHPGYDGVASNLGFEPMSDGNWLRSASISLGANEQQANHVAE